MYFESLSALMDMDGHGSFVWAAYGIALVIMVSLVVGPLMQKRRFLTEHKMHQRREQAQTESPASSS